MSTQPVITEQPSVETQIPETPAQSPEKIWVAEYQATDENGNPIGRPTKLGPFATPEELIAAQQRAHIEATRAYFRVKNAKTDPKVPRSEFQPKPGDSDDRARFRQNLEEEIGAPIEEVRYSLKVARNVDTKFEVDTFVSEHPEYYVCAENRAAMLGYLEANNLEITKNNLEVALEALNLQGKLLPVPPPAAPAPPAPAVEPPNPPSPEPARPSGSTGVIPGQFSGRPVVHQPGLTKAEIAKWSAAQMRQEMRNPARRAEIERVLNS